MASGRVLTVQEVSELLGFWQWPLKARYTDTQYPGEQEMYFFGDATLEFMNERGNWSDRHAHWSFFYEPSIYDASNELRLRVRDFHCTGTWGVNQGYAKELIFKCSGQFAMAEVRRAESDGSMEFIQKQDSSTIIQGEFSLKNLGYFIKCTNLCNNIEMYLENDLPLIVKYSVASLGDIKLCLAPLPSS